MLILPSGQVGWFQHLPLAGLLDECKVIIPSWTSIFAHHKCKHLEDHDIYIILLF